MNEPTTNAGSTSAPTDTDYVRRYGASMLGVFGTPQLVLDRGDGCHVVDIDGRRYLDLLGGIAVNALGHAHPAVVDAVTKQASQAIHVSNFFTTRAQVELGERLLRVLRAPEGSRAFFCNSGAEANEAAVKLARRTGRPTIVAARGGFHGRTMGALSLTAKTAYREPFEPLLPGVVHVDYDDLDQLEACLDQSVAAVVLEPIQGEAGVVVPSDDYLVAARRLTERVGALLVIDEVQTGIGRTGTWLGHEAVASGAVRPDAVTLAKGLGGGVPIGALVTFGSAASQLLTAGQHGSTFGGNPLACAAAAAVLETIESDGLLDHVQRMGDHVASRVDALGDPRVLGQRGRGLLRGLVLRDEVAVALVAAAREAGFLVNAPAPDLVRLAPPLVITASELDTFFDALPGLLDGLDGLEGKESQ